MPLGTSWKKIDNDLAADDEATHALIGQRLALNIEAAHEDRRVSMSHCYRRMTSGGAASDTALVPQVSTHPERWYEWPAMVWCTTGTDKIRFTLDYESDMGDGSGSAGSTDTVDIRVRMPQIGTVSSETTLTKTSARASVAIECDTGIIREAGWYLVQIQIRSVRSGTVVTNGTAIEWLQTGDFGGSVQIDDPDGSITLTAGRSHYAMIVDAGTRPGGSTDDQERTYHVPQVLAATDTTGAEYTLRLYPHAQSPGESVPTVDKGLVTADLYPVGYLQVYGWSIESVTGSSSDLQGPSRNIYEPQDVVRTSGIRSLIRSHDLLYRERGHIVIAGPRSGHRDQPRFGAMTSGVASIDIAGCVTVRRPQVSGYDVVLLAYEASIGTTGDDPGTIKLSATLDPVTGTTNTISNGATPITRARRAMYFGDDGFIGAYNSHANVSQWGAGDLLGPGESQRLTPIRFFVPYADDAIDVTLATLLISVDDSPANVMAISVREVI